MFQYVFNGSKLNEVGPFLSFVSTQLAALQTSVIYRGPFVDRRMCATKNVHDMKTEEFLELHALHVARILYRIYIHICIYRYIKPIVL